MSWDEIVSLRDSLQTELENHRTRRGIVPAVVRCRKCGGVGEGASSHISVRAMLISLRRFGIAPEDDVRRIERDWAHFRKAKALDLYGRPQRERVNALLEQEEGLSNSGLDPPNACLADHCVLPKLEQ